MPFSPPTGLLVRTSVRMTLSAPPNTAHKLQEGASILAMRPLVSIMRLLGDAPLLFRTVIRLPAFISEPGPRPGRRASRNG